jgi:hypothetical protein
VKHRFSLKAGAGLAVIVAPAALIGFAPAVASASTVRPAQVPTSTQYAGWLAGSYGPRVTTFSADTEFKVPAVTGCGTTPGDFVVIGVGDPTGETSVTAVGVAVGCTTAGAAFYTAEIDINGTVTPVAAVISPGDEIALKLGVTSSLTNGSFADKTTHVTKSFKGEGSEPSGSCIGIDGSENGTSGDPPVPDFGQVVFTDSTINGTTISGSGATRVDMADSSGVLQISTGALTKKGNGFTSTFENVG